MTRPNVGTSIDEWRTERHLRDRRIVWRRRAGDIDIPCGGSAVDLGGGARSTASRRRREPAAARDATTLSIAEMVRKRAHPGRH
jgi:hypothetical protein